MKNREIVKAMSKHKVKYPKMILTPEEVKFVELMRKIKRTTADGLLLTLERAVYELHEMIDDMI